MSIAMENLHKRYGGHAVVSHVSLEVEDGEFFVLLGPSGSGKSTVLRMIAGLVEVDEGRIMLHGRDVTNLSPQRRGVGFVFQHYALFGHMTVADNIEFPLRIRRVPQSERERRREDLLEVVGLTGLGNRMPAQLSGGQRQRVALARALAHRPEVLLLDEPFGALDARIRSELRRTIRQIQQDLKITTIFVTHDQDEAFELADRLGVIDFGRLLEVGPPDELYLRPRTEFVATFLGSANLMVGEVEGDGVRLGPRHFTLGTTTSSDDQARRIQVLFRPEDVAIKDDPEALAWPMLGEAVVQERSFVGSYERLRLRLPPLPGVRPITPAAPFGGDFIVVEASRSQHQARRYPVRVGEKVWAGVRRIHALVHPGLSIMLLTNGSRGAVSAVRLGGEIARFARARITILAHDMDQSAGGAELQKAREAIGSGTGAVESRVAVEPVAEAVAGEETRRHYDLVVTTHPERGDLDEAEGILTAGDHHLLLVPVEGRVPSRVLICVAVGEPGKEGIQFVGRLVRHLGAKTTILTVLSPSAGREESEHARRFLVAGVRTLATLGVPAEVSIRTGDAAEEILRAAEEGSHEMIALGTPLGFRRRQVALGGVVENVVRRAGQRLLLITRSHQVLK